MGGRTWFSSICQPAIRQTRQMEFRCWCAYYGNVSAIKHLLAHGASIESFGENLGGHAARSFLIDRGADVNRTSAGTGESPLHAALRTIDRLRRRSSRKYYSHTTASWHTRPHSDSAETVVGGFSHPFGLWGRNGSHLVGQPISQKLS